MLFPKRKKKTISQILKRFKEQCKKTRSDPSERWENRSPRCKDTRVHTTHSEAFCIVPVGHIWQNICSAKAVSFWSRSRSALSHLKMIVSIFLKFYLLKFYQKNPKFNITKYFLGGILILRKK